MGERPRRSGRLKVVEPSPAPQVVPSAANNAAYVVRDTADPSHKSHPLGADDRANGAHIPVGQPTAAAADAADAAASAPCSARSR